MGTFIFCEPISVIQEEGIELLGVMIPPVKLEAATVVTIAPTPSTQPPDTTGDANQLQGADNKSNSALEITQQPPATWYKDQYGRKATFDLNVKRTGVFCAQCVEQRILAVQLLYENGKVVEKQEILNVMSGQCLDKNMQSSLAIRIAEVSKNHLNQRFRVEIAVPRCQGGCDYKTSVVSDPVLVLSKKKKRPNKQNAETESPARPKKAKRAAENDTPTRKMSPESLNSSQTSNGTLTGNMAAAIAEMEQIPPRSKCETAPFTAATPNLCLWANAAFDLLYKLQWQRVPASRSDHSGAKLDEILAQAISKAYKCPSCQETYGQVPTHREDCDLKLLLEQSGQTDVSAAEAGNHFTAQQWSSTKSFEWPDYPKPMYSGGDITPKVDNTSQEMHGSGEASGKGFDPAANLNINSWEDYSSLSKLLYSTSYLGGFDGRSPEAATALSPTLKWTGVLPPVGTLSPGFPTLPSATISSALNQYVPGSQRFSALLSATKDVSPATADLLRESEAALHGDGNIVNSLGNLSVSDLIRSGDVAGNESRLGHRPVSLSMLLSGDQPVLDTSSEKDVRVIMASDFRGCGFPALDGSFNLNDQPAELRFAPSIFPLPKEMLEELETTASSWKGNPSICYKRKSVEINTEESLVRLKSDVLHQVMRLCERCR
ncbi:hypothetical protein V7S43_000810 [Phytophthora oleae]|uniref:Uncharacterized protein n=1 Tax=Phytophthora oleae TaxID=2107226 RepID=A0ABD3GCH7_9STRA